jgi:voltage-gated potassium channel
MTGRSPGDFHRAGPSRVAANNARVGLTQRFLRRLEAARSPIWRAAYIAGVVTLGFTFAAAAIMRVADADTYPTFGQAIWWAAQTVTTVGYGDVVPESDWGRGVAVVLMIAGIGFLTVFTASIVSVSMYRVTRAAEARQRDALLEHLMKLEAQVERVEAAVVPKGADERAEPGPPS